jgi:hypothetical protein
MEIHVSPDGRLRLLVVPGDDGDVSLGFEGFPWHTHADVLAAAGGLPQAEAVRRFVGGVVGGASVLALWYVGDELRDVWVSDDPARDATYPQPGESVVLRYWDGRAWHGGGSPSMEVTGHGI